MKNSKFTFAIALAGSLAGGSMLFASASPAEAGPGGRACRAPVHSSAVAGGRYKPFHVKKEIARMKAMRKWRRKTVNRFGREFRRWRFARAKDVYFEKDGPRVIAILKGKPCKSNRFRRYSNNDYKLNDRRLNDHQLNNRPHNEYNGPRGGLHKRITY